MYLHLNLNLHLYLSIFQRRVEERWLGWCQTGEKWSGSGWWEPCGRFVDQHLGLSTPRKCRNSTKIYSLPSSPLTLHTVSLVDLICHLPSVQPCPLLQWFPDLDHWSWPLCWAPKPCSQLLLDNPSKSSISTSHSTYIIWTYHSPPPEKPCCSSWWMALSSTHLPKQLTWESRITPVCAGPCPIITKACWCCH